MAPSPCTHWFCRHHTIPGGGCKGADAGGQCQDVVEFFLDKLQVLTS